MLEIHESLAVTSVDVANHPVREHHQHVSPYACVSCQQTFRSLRPAQHVLLMQRPPLALEAGSSASRWRLPSRRWRLASPRAAESSWASPCGSWRSGPSGLLLSGPRPLPPPSTFTPPSLHKSSCSIAKLPPNQSLPFTAPAASFPLSNARMYAAPIPLLLRVRRAPMLAAMPRTTPNPMLWSAADLELLKGSSARAAAEERAAALRAEWAALAPLLRADPAAFPPALWSEAAFGAALAVVLRCAVFLPAANIFALIPLADQVTRRAAGPLGAPARPPGRLLCAPSGADACCVRFCFFHSVILSLWPPSERKRLCPCSAQRLTADPRLRPFLGEGPTAFMDFDAARGSVVLIADRQHNPGDLVRTLLEAIQCSQVLTGLAPQLFCGVAADRLAFGVKNRRSYRFLCWSSVL